MKNPLTALARALGFGGKQTAIPGTLSALTNRPVMMSRLALDALLSGFNAAAPTPKAGSDDWEPHGSRPDHLITVVGSVGVISISGPLFQKFGLEAWWWGGQGYDVIKAAHMQLVANPQITHILHDLDTPGGQCSGCFDTVDAIAATRGTKPIIAVINDCAASAGYALASAADKIVTTRTGTAGSIGVVATHLDQSAYLAKVGIKYEFIVSGEKKAAYNSVSPMSDQERADLQAEVDRLAGIFIGTVAKNRGLEASKIEAMQAGCFYGESAIAAGLCDEMGTLDSVLAGLTSAEIEDMPKAPEPASAPTAEATPLPKSLLITDSDRAEEQARLDRADVVDALVAAKLRPEILSALMEPKAPITPQTVSARIDRARAVADLCTACGDVSLAAEYVAANTGIEVVRAQLLALKAADGPELVTTAPAQSQPKLSTTASVYARRRNADPSGAQHHGTEKK